MLDILHNDPVGYKTVTRHEFSEWSLDATRMLEWAHYTIWAKISSKRMML